MNKIRWAGIALGSVVVVAGFMRNHEEDFGAAQATTDRETVNCLAHELTHDEKARIARYTAAHDTEHMRPVFTEILSRCVVRSDQWERRSQLVAGARQALSYDPEFRQLLSASSMSMELAQRP